MTHEIAIKLLADLHSGEELQSGSNLRTVLLAECDVPCHKLNAKELALVRSKPIVERVAKFFHEFARALNAAPQERSPRAVMEDFLGGEALDVTTKKRTSKKEKGSAAEGDAFARSGK